MFCSGCGLAQAPGVGFCPQCGRPVPGATVSGLEFELQNYAGKVKALGIVWLIYAGFSLLLGIAGLTFASAFFSGRFGPWMHGPVPPFWFGPAFVHLIWVVLLVRSGLALATGWGLMERAPWGRFVAIVAAILNLIKFPFGTALGIWTLAVLLGYRNRSLYEQL